MQLLHSPVFCNNFLHADGNGTARGLKSKVMQPVNPGCSGSSAEDPVSQQFVAGFNTDGSLLSSTLMKAT